jgi:hypothetical protein
MSILILDSFHKRGRSRKFICPLFSVVGLKMMRIPEDDPNRDQSIWNKVL